MWWVSRLGLWRIALSSMCSECNIITLDTASRYMCRVCFHSDINEWVNWPNRWRMPWKYGRHFPSIDHKMLQPVLVIFIMECCDSLCRFQVQRIPWSICEGTRNDQLYSSKLPGLYHYITLTMLVKRVEFHPRNRNIWNRLHCVNKKIEEVAWNHLILDSI